MKRNTSMVRVVVVMVAAVIFSWFGDANAQTKGYSGKKVFFINSYHEGYEWSDGIEKGLFTIAEGTGVEVHLFRMDSKRNTDEAFIKQKALEAKKEIDTVKPDVIITADDNAFKYIVMPYYKDSEVPVVFCGLNWDVSIYGAPYNNTTGMVEVALIPRLIDYLKPHARGSRVAYLAADVLTARKEGEYYNRYFNLNIHEQYVKTFEEWKNAFISLQKEADILIVGNNAGIGDWDDAVAKAFAQEYTEIPTGCIYTWLAPYSLMGFTKVEEEQGAWAMEAALMILDGTPVSEIPIVKNKKGRLILNFKIADKLNVVFSPLLLKNAKCINE